MSKRRVFVDTNVILEAFRTDCWTAICQHYAIETVEKCIEETQTGDPTEPGRIVVDHRELTSGLTATHSVSKRDLAVFALQHPECQALDDGELHLLAWLNAQGLLPHVLVLVSTADKAAIVATGRLGGLDSLVSLEHLVQSSGVSRGQVSSLKEHYRSGWLDGIKVKVRFGMIP